MRSTLVLLCIALTPGLRSDSGIRNNRAGILTIQTSRRHGQKLSRTLESSRPVSVSRRSWPVRRTGHDRRPVLNRAPRSAFVTAKSPRTVFVARDEHSTVPAPFSIPLPFEEHPIDLATALKLADAANPTIGAARALVLEALANQLAARVLLVPSLNSGVGYHGHQGFLQRVSGKIISLSEQSLSMGCRHRIRWSQEPPRYPA